MEVKSIGVGDYLAMENNHINSSNSPWTAKITHLGIVTPRCGIGKGYLVSQDRGELNGMLKVRVNYDSYVYWHVIDQSCLKEGKEDGRFVWEIK